MLYDLNDHKTVEIAVKALARDFALITGTPARVSTSLEETGNHLIIVGSLGIFQKPVYNFTDF